MEILNYTPHPIHVWVGEEKKTILPSGLARVEAKHEIQSYIGEIPLYRTVFGEVLGLPEQEKDTFIIVSLVVKSASNRADLISPTDYVRDEKGQILGCKGFSI